MKKSFKILSVSLMMATAVFGLASCGGGAKDSYIIGLSGPLTGDYAVYGKAVENSAKMAAEEINAAGGVNGHKLKVLAMDDQATPTAAATNYTKLYEDGMQVSLGCVTSGACIEFAKWANQDKVFCLTPSATADAVAASGVYQICFSDSGQGVAAAKFAKEEFADKGKSIGILYDSSDAYSTGILSNFEKQITGAKKAAFTQDAKTDFSQQIQTLKDCDLVFLPIYYSDAATFIKQGKGIIKATATYYGCDGLDGIDSVEGFDVTEYTQEISFLSHFNASSTDAATSAYVSKYTAKFPKDAPNQFGAGAYDCVYTIKKLMENAVAKGKDIPVDISAKDLNTILTAEIKDANFSVDGVTGKNIKWNADYTVSKEAQKFIVNPNRAAIAG